MARPYGHQHTIVSGAQTHPSLRPGGGLPHTETLNLTESCIVTLSCADRQGIVHAVTGYLVAQKANITEAAQFNDPSTGLFFMRVRFDVAQMPLQALRESFVPVADAFKMNWGMFSAAARTRTVIMVSKQGHCLNDLLFRHQAEGLPIDIRAIVSNHDEHRALATSYKIPFHLIEVTPSTKASAEAQFLALVNEVRAELVVLARYMQVLSPSTCQALAGRAINIHHSFLPSFKGAKPYQQAFERGVKLIGATAHYVTSNLDEGPIIEQDIARVDHAMNPTQLAALGRDVESVVLARAVKWHAEHRVLVDGSKTVVFK